MEPSFVRQLFVNKSYFIRGLLATIFGRPLNDRAITMLRDVVAEAATDNLQIDQLVYKLYGLTDKEIALVEEATA